MSPPKLSGTRDTVPQALPVLPAPPTPARPPCTSISEPGRSRPKRLQEFVSSCRAAAGASAGARAAAGTPQAAQLALGMWWDPAQGHGGSPEPAAARLCSQSSTAAAPPQAPPPQPTRDPPSAACARAPRMVRRAGGQELLLAKNRGTLCGRGVISRDQKQQGTNQTGLSPQWVPALEQYKGDVWFSLRERQAGCGTVALPCPGPAPRLGTPGLSWHNLFPGRATPASSVPHGCLPLPLPCPPLTGCCPS